jgi:hypothetical protein
MSRDEITYRLECGHDVTCGCSHGYGDMVLCMTCFEPRKVIANETDQDE